MDQGAPRLITVIGLDPGSVRFGYGVVQVDAPGRIHYVEAGVIEAGSGSTVYQRLVEIGKHLEEVLSERKPDVAAMEKGFVSVQKGSLQQGTLVSAAARGAAGMLVSRRGIGIHEYANNTIKKAITGHGKAEKELVADVVRRLLSLRRSPDPDAGDALAAAITHARLGLGAR